MTKLKRCPFCGTRPYVTVNKYATVPQLANVRYSVSCDFNPCKIQPITDAYEYKEKAIAAWNERSKHK